MGSDAISSAPSKSFAAVTCSDTTSFTRGEGRGLLVATSGNYTILPAGPNSTAVTVYLVAGVVHPIRCVRVNSTGAASTSGVVVFY